MTAQLKAFVCFLLILAVGMVISGCFATLQSAKIRRGFHLTLTGSILSDQTRNGKPQGSDVIGFVSPSVGFGNTTGFEFGLPFGWYLEEGFASLDEDEVLTFGQEVKNFLVLPYLKVGFNQDKKDKFAFVGQTSYIFPASLTFIYSHDFKGATPYVSLKRVFSGGPAGDDPMITRYQEHNQSIWAIALGVEWAVPLNPAIEVGMFRNSYEEGFVYGHFGGVGQKRVLYDFFLGGKITL
jgi:hypothetical protein